MHFSWFGLALPKCAFVAWLLVCLPAFPQDGWPNGPVKIVVPFNPGGSTDIIARVMADQLQGKFGNAFVVENRAGGAGSIGTSAVARSAPDGATLVVGPSSSFLINQFQFESPPYDSLKDLTLISLLASGPSLLIAHPKLAAENLNGLAESIRNNPGGINYGSYGMGSYAHLVLAYFNKSLDADMTHVAYRGEAQLVQAVLAGEVDIGLVSAAPAVAHIRAGSVHAVALTGESRLDILPEVRTFAEQGFDGPEYKSIGWIGLAAPAGLPNAIARQIAAQVSQTMHGDAMNRKMREIGFFPVGSSHEEFLEIYQRDFQVWKRMFEASGAQPQAH